MKKLTNKIAKFLADESGPTTVEYACMLMLILLACLTGITMFGQETANTWQRNSDSINEAVNE